ncbi:MAG: radical SAM protein, partial [Actinobacteria bacterium]|nr:radical SAM protein [Actinomycetota bacterium]
MDKENYFPNLEKIYRKTLLYKTNVEYGDYSLNHVLGCSHGCKYPCYAMLMAKRFGKVRDYDEWINPKIVINSLDLLDREIKKYKTDIKFVHLCFTTDPFMFDYPDL